MAAPETSETLHIAPARPDQAAAISALVMAVFEAFVAAHYGAEGRATFTREASPEALARSLAGGSAGFLATAAGGDFVGYLEMSGSHVSKLFVASGQQRRGIARRLLTRALEERPGQDITVNAAPGSSDAYRRLGFRPTAPWRLASGLTFLPMARPGSPEEG